MKLALKDIPKRAVIKYDSTIKSSGDKINGYMKFGTNNDYPQIVERIINGSVSGKAVADRYAKFLTGRGFANESINNIIIGHDSFGKNITLKSLLRYVAKSISINYGAYIHMNYNLDGQIVNIRPVPFKNCRFSAIDDVGYTSKIGVYDNWEKDSDTVRSKGASFDKSKIVWYNAYNPNKEALASQIKEAKSIDKYKGQIYFIFLDNYYLYPLSPFDEVLLDCDTEYQLSVFKNNQTRNGMTKKTIMRCIEPSNTEDEEEFNEAVKDFVSMEGSNLIVIYDELDKETGNIKKSGAFDLDSLESNIEDDLFETWQKELTNNIRKAVAGLPSILIDYEENKLSTTSGESIQQATNFYNAVTLDDRAAISEMFAEIFKNFADEKVSSIVDWTIQPVELYNEIDEPDDPMQIKLKSQAELRGSVGGVTALIALQDSVSKKVTSINSAVAILREIYGIDEMTAREMIGQPVETNTTVPIT